MKASATRRGCTASAHLYAVYRSLPRQHGCQCLVEPLLVCCGRKAHLDSAFSNTSRVLLSDFRGPSPEREALMPGHQGCDGLLRKATDRPDTD
jgi:hypothetical protein